MAELVRLTTRQTAVLFMVVALALPALADNFTVSPAALGDAVNFGILFEGATAPL
jgi:hypothetical protein